MKLIEPKELEIKIIGTIIDQLDEARDQTVLIQHMAELTKTANISTSNPEAFFADAARIALNSYHFMTEFLKLYIGDCGSARNKARQEMLADMLETPKAFKARTGKDYDIVDADERADMHLTYCGRTIEKFVELIVLEELKGANIGMDTDPLSSEGIHIPFEVHPPLIGLAHAYHVFMGLYIEQVALLQNESALSARALRDDAYREMVESLRAEAEQPSEPSMPSNQPPLRAKHFH